MADLPSLLDSPAYLNSQPQPSAAPPDPMRALGDPDFRAFVAQRARELAAAQQDANSRQKWADLANGFERGGSMIAGRAPDQAHMQQNSARAQLPVTQLHERQQAEGTAIKDLDVAQQVQERSGKAQMLRDSMDPNSAMSKRARMLAVAQKLIPPSYTGPYSASMHQDMLKGAQLDVARQHYESMLNQHKETMARLTASDAETKRHHLAIEGGAGKSPAKLTQELAHAADAVKQLDDYEAQQKKEGSGPLNAVNAAVNPYAAGDRTTRGMAQALGIVVARGLHGGAPTKIELEEAQQYLPQTGDPPETFTRKMAAIRKTLVDRQAELKSTMQGMGNAKAGNVVDLGGSAAGSPEKPAAPASPAAPDTSALRKKYGL
jgi:hypothetical protein